MARIVMVIIFILAIGGLFAPRTSLNMNHDMEIASAQAAPQGNMRDISYRYDDPIWIIAREVKDDPDLARAAELCSDDSVAERAMPECERVVARLAPYAATLAAKRAADVAWLKEHLGGH